jgi:hypothetical protein
VITFAEQNELVVRRKASDAMYPVCHDWTRRPDFVAADDSVWFILWGFLHRYALRSSNPRNPDFKVLNPLVHLLSAPGSGKSRLCDHLAHRVISDVDIERFIEEAQFESGPTLTAEQIREFHREVSNGVGIAVSFNSHQTLTGNENVSYALAVRVLFRYSVLFSCVS